MDITSAQYILDQDGNNGTILAVIDGETTNVPLVAGNRHYAEILKQVADGELTIADAD